MYQSVDIMDIGVAEFYGGHGWVCCRKCGGRYDANLSNVMAAA